MAKRTTTKKEKAVEPKTSAKKVEAAEDLAEPKSPEEIETPADNTDVENSTSQEEEKVEETPVEEPVVEEPVEKAVLGVTVNCQKLNLRPAPSKDNQAIASIMRGTGLEVLEDLGDWYKVKFNDKTGYVMKEFTK